MFTNVFVISMTDVNECGSSSTNNCHINATCTDTEGSFMCTCNDGNAGDGVICEGKTKLSAKNIKRYI